MWGWETFDWPRSWRGRPLLDKYKRPLTLQELPGEAVSSLTGICGFSGDANEF